MQTAYQLITEDGMVHMIAEVEDFLKEIYPHITSHGSAEASSKEENEDKAKLPVFTLLGEIAD